MSIGTIWTHRDMIERLEGWEAAAEFEQIVLKYQAEQIAFEQERIIKLLPSIIKLGNIDYLFDIDKEMPELVAEAEALIKEQAK